MTALKKPPAPVSVFTHRPDTSEYLVVEHDTPLPTARIVSGKYDKVFEQLKPGSCIRCATMNEYQHIASTLRKHLDTGKWPKIAGCVVKGVSKHPKDGLPRVFVVTGAAKKRR